MGPLWAMAREKVDEGGGGGIGEFAGAADGAAQENGTGGEGTSGDEDLASAGAQIELGVVADGQEWGLD